MAADITRAEPRVISGPALVCWINMLTVKLLKRPRRMRAVREWRPSLKMRSILKGVIVVERMKISQFCSVSW